MNEVDELMDCLKQLGYKARTGRGGHRVFSRPGYQPFALAATPSDHRSLENCLSDLAKCAGFASKAELERFLGRRGQKSDRPRTKRRSPGRVRRNWSGAATPEEIYAYREGGVQEDSSPASYAPELTRAEIEVRIARVKHEMRGAIGMRLEELRAELVQLEVDLPHARGAAA